MEEDQGAAALAPANKKREEKYRKKDPKSWENVMKAIEKLDDAAKLVYIGAKYNEIYNESRKNNVSAQASVKQCTILQKENDHIQSELTKSVVHKARLESLCRELQKQNKQIKEENIAKIKEEEERRKEVSSKFANKLTDINNMMDENKEKSEKLREENLRMTAKLSELYEQFKQREEDVAQMTKQLELEKKLSQATLAKLQAEKELYAKEQAIMKSNLDKSESNCHMLLNRVQSLQDQIGVYKTQYSEFESTLSKSNEVYSTFQTEVRSMTRKMSDLEKEVVTWKMRHQDTVKALMKMTEESQAQELLLTSCERKIDQLQKLCRQLQADRSAYLKVLKVNGIEPPTAATLAKDTTQFTKKEKELQILKDNLQAVQNELSRLSDNKTEENASQEPKSTESTDNAAKSASPEGASSPQEASQVPTEHRIISASPIFIPKNPYIRTGLVPEEDKSDCVEVPQEEKTSDNQKI